jgi:hypothetical protein
MNKMHRLPHLIDLLGKQDSSFKNQLKLMLIDKIILSVIIAIGAWVGTIWLEQHKLEYSTNLDLNKKKIEKLGEVWEKAYLLNRKLPDYISAHNAFYKKTDGEIRQSLNEMQIAARSKKYNLTKEYEQKLDDYSNDLPQKIREHKYKVREKYLAEFNETLEKNRFWIDDKYLKVLEEYSLTITKIAELKAIKSKKIEKELEKKVKRLRELATKIDDIRIEIIGTAIHRKP